MTIEAPPGLHDEIIELYAQYRDEEGMSPSMLLSTLNGPARIQRRGFQITAKQLLAIIIDIWRIKPNSRWLVVYEDGAALGQLFEDREEAADAAMASGGIVVRVDIDLPGDDEELACLECGKLLGTRHLASCGKRTVDDDNVYVEDCASEDEEEDSIPANEKSDGHHPT